MRLLAYAGLVTVLGCGTPFRDTVVNGVPNLTEVSPGLWRMGHPAATGDDGLDAWRYVAARVTEPGKPVLLVQLHDDTEANGDAAAAERFGWSFLRVPLPPEDDKPWTVLVKPRVIDVQSVVQYIAQAHADGSVVVWHCVHGRDRTGLVMALVGMRLLGWSKGQAWNDMLAHGFRWELPDLDAYWLQDVR